MALSNPSAKISIDTIRTLAMDAVQAAASGHPGAPMGLAPVGYALWRDILRFDPDDPSWPNRDRFVLSAGHASTLLYALLHLAGVKDPRTGKPAVSLDDLKHFRQLDSLTPGHPEYGRTAGVETTTGPLGQGAANSVGMAAASRWLAARYNRPGFELFDYDVFALAGDGCMMEGITSEAASLAGHLKLSNLCWIYDSNRITIEGKTDLAFSEDVGARFTAYGWRVVRVLDANDLGMLAWTFGVFKETTDRPTLIIVSSHIAYGAPRKQDSETAHGEPLGADEIRAAKKSYGWPEDAQFLVPPAALADFDAGIGARGRALHTAWRALWDRYKTAFPGPADELERIRDGRLPDGWDKDLPVFPADEKGQATRVSSGAVLNAIAKNVPWIVGGSADLAPSTKTKLTFPDAGVFQAGSYGGRNFHFGVREHAMTAVLNGLALSGLRPYGSSFLVFSDYARPAIRLSAIMKLPVVHIYTHDSIAVGEDGPTHEPVEHIPSLRAIPGLVVLRPADANEVAEAWRVIMNLKCAPALLLLTRQNVPTFDRSQYASAAGVARGAYVLADAVNGRPDVILMASGSEVALCLQAARTLASENIHARVVSMPSWDLFEKQDQTYKDAVLPPDIHARVAVEMAVPLGWERYAGRAGRILGLRSFGLSAPLKDLLKKFGFTPDAVIAAAKDALRAAGR
jgi:transketolase